MQGTALFLTHEASRTGAPLMLLNFLRWFDQTYDMRLRILAGKSGDLLPEFAELGEVNCFEAKPSLAYRSMRRLNLYPTRASSRKTATHLTYLRQVLAGSDIRLIYANSVATAKMVQFLEFLDCPVICHVHELDVSIRALGAPNFDVINLMEQQTCAYVAVSDAVKANLVEKHGVPAGKIKVVLGLGPPLACRNAHQLQSRDVRGELAIPADAKIVCGCGSIEKRKGTDLFLEVATHVADRDSRLPIHFVWVGGQSYEVTHMRRQVARLGLRGVVHFVGQKEDVTPYLNASELILLTSREESLSLVMLEGALLKKPTICFDKSGHPPEFVQQGTGIAIPDFDPKKMADKLVEVLSSPGLCSQMGAAAKRKVLDSYDFNSGAAKIGKIIEEMAQSNRAEHLWGRHPQ